MKVGKSQAELRLERLFMAILTRFLRLLDSGFFSKAFSWGLAGVSEIRRRLGVSKETSMLSWGEPWLWKVCEMRRNLYNYEDEFMYGLIE